MHGLERVVVADCSLMPVVPRANTNVPAVVVGERIADTLLAGARGDRARAAVRGPVGGGVARRDPDAVAALLADDVTFSSPAVHRPYEGRELVAALLGHVIEVFGELPAPPSMRAATAAS